MAFSRRLDDTVRADGDRFVSGTCFGKALPQRHDPVRRPACIQFSVADNIFQFSALSVCLCMARGALGSDIRYGNGILPHIKKRRDPHGALFTLGDVCRISQSVDIPSQRLRKRGLHTVLLSPAKRAFPSLRRTANTAAHILCGGVSIKADILPPE